MGCVASRSWLQFTHWNKTGWEPTDVCLSALHVAGKRLLCEQSGTLGGKELVLINGAATGSKWST